MDACESPSDVGASRWQLSRHAPSRLYFLIIASIAPTLLLTNPPPSFVFSIARAARYLRTADATTALALALAPARFFFLSATCLLTSTTSTTDLTDVKNAFAKVCRDRTSRTVRAMYLRAGQMRAGSVWGEGVSGMERERAGRKENSGADRE